MVDDTSTRRDVQNTAALDHRRTRTLNRSAPKVGEMTPQSSDSALVQRLEGIFDESFAPIPGREFDVTDHGAVGDGETLCTDAIQDAIETAADADGLRVDRPTETVVLRTDDGEEPRQRNCQNVAHPVVDQR